jgi:hypothetical protein
MQTTTGIDLAKNVFCLHGCDANGKAVLRKRQGDSGQNQSSASIFSLLKRRIRIEK